MTTENTDALILGEEVTAAETPKDVADTTMEGDFSPAEKEGLAEYQKLMEAMDKGEEYTPPGEVAAEEKPEEAAKAEETPPDDGKKADEDHPQPTEDDLAALVASQADAVAAAEEALKAAEDKAIALGDQLENGEISQAKYDIEYRRIMREIERTEEGLIAARTGLSQTEAAAEQAAIQADPWIQAANSFLSADGNDIFNDGEHHEGLKQAITFAAGLKQNAQKSPAEIIDIAASTYRAMVGLSAPAPKAAPAKPAPKPEPNIPPMLGQMQAALPNNDEGPFAHLSNLSGPAFEDAYSKLSPAQREAFMDSLSG